MRFKPGEQVVCVNNAVPNPISLMPKVGEVVTIKGYCPVFKGNIDLVEYPVDKRGVLQSTPEWRFEPLADITEIHEILSAEPQTESV